MPWVSACPRGACAAGGRRRALHLVPPLRVTLWRDVRPRALVSHAPDCVILAADARVHNAASQAYEPITLALKVVLPHRMDAALARITQREDAMLRRVQALRDGVPRHTLPGVHNLVAFHGCERGVAWRRNTATVIALEYVPGPSLCAVVDAQAVPLARPCVAAYARQAAHAVAFLHHHDMIHRDVKLDNLVLNPVTERVVLVDFGFVAPVTGPCTDFPGSAEYAAPELFEGRPYNGKAADVYSFGVVLFALVTGDLPFRPRPGECQADLGRRVLAHKPNLRRVPQDVRGLLRTLLAKRPARRPDMAGVLRSTFFAPGRKDGHPAPQELRGGGLAGRRH